MARRAAMLPSWTTPGPSGGTNSYCNHPKREKCGSLSRWTQRPSQRRFMSLRLNRPMKDLAEGKDFAHEFREEFQERGYEFLLPPTVAAELNILSIYGGEPQKTFASQALHELRAWKCQTFSLSDTKLAIAERFCRSLSE